MKKLFGILALLYCIELAAQTPGQTFIIQDPGPVQNIAAYESALSYAFLDRYRLADQRAEMHFVEGVVVELLSAKELIAMGMRVNTDVLGTVPVEDVKFTMQSTGRIVIWTPTQTTRP